MAEMEELSKLPEYLGKIGPKGKEASIGVSALSGAMRELIGLMGPTYLGGHLSGFIRSIGLASENQKKFLGVTFESTQQLRLFTSGLALAVTGMATYLDAADKVERKQSELNRAYGIGAISITDYYKQLVQASGMGGKAAHESAEDLIKAMREQREGTEQEINAILPLFIKYSLGISKSFPQDFVFMHERLGMGLDKIADSYETIAANAAIARVPLDLYKNTVFSVSAELHQYGLSTDAAIRFTNLFTDDVAKNTLTMNEAQAAARSFTQMQFTAAGFGERVRATMFLRKAMAAGEVPSGLRESLEETTRAQYGPGARLAELNTMQMQYVLSRLDPKVFAQVTGIAMTESMKNIPKEMKPQIFPQFWGGMEYEFFQKRLGKALETGGGGLVGSVADVMKGIEPTTKEAIIAINALRKQIEQNTKDMREWYYPVSQFFDWLRSKGLGVEAGILTGAAGAAPGALMTAFALKGIAGFGGGAVAGGLGAGGVGGLAMGLAGLAGPLIVLTGALTDAYLVAKLFAEGLKLANEKQYQKQQLEKQMETPSGQVYLISRILRARQAGRMGFPEQEQALYKDIEKELGFPVVPGVEKGLYALYKEKMEGLGKKPLAYESIEKAAGVLKGRGVPVLLVQVDKGVKTEIINDTLNIINKPGSPIQQITK